MRVSAADRVLFQLEAEVHKTEGAGGVYELPFIPEENRRLCRQCARIDEQILSPTVDHMQLGTISSLKDTASHCETCRSIILACPLRALYDDLVTAVVSFENNSKRLFLSYQDENWARSKEGWDPLLYRPANASLRFLSITGSPAEEAGRICNPKQVDLNVLRRWIHCCDSTHRADCNAPAAILSGEGFSSPRMLRLIDLENECVVTRPSSEPYVALSYVWGRVSTVEARCDNINELAQPRSLSSSSGFQIPKTIRDAIRLAKLLGEKYLWVDSLCIVQDDEIHKQTHLNAMASIYVAASFTIVVAGAKDANVGIAGLGDDGHTRNVPYQVLRFPSGTFTNTGPGASNLDISCWAWRAWTFQERLFSRRLLIVNGSRGLVSWICQQAEWTEEEYRPSEGLEWISNQEHQGRPSHVREFNKFPLWPDLISYSQLVTHYSSKCLTFENDILNAFSGVTTVLERSFKCHFISGLPEAFFDLALLWQPADGIRRRKDRNGNHIFPSWSWTGWVGRISYDFMEQCTGGWLFQEGLPIFLAPLVIWYISSSLEHGHSTSDNESSSRRRINDIWTRLYGSGSEPGEQLPSNWRREYEQGIAFYTHPSTPGGRFCHPVLFVLEYDIRTERPSPDPESLYLSTRAPSAWFRLRDVGPPPDRYVILPNQQPYSTREADLWTEDGQLAGKLILSVSDSEILNVTEPCELIAISTGTTLNPNANANFFSDGDSNQISTGLGEWRDGRRPTIGETFINVLWIERAGKIAYRRALGRVFREVWDRQRIEWIDIVFG